MDEQFLTRHRREPELEYGRALRDRLRRLEDEEVGASRSGSRMVPALAALLGVAVIAALFLMPSVRAAAQSVLDLFRVRTFAAVPFDASRLDRIKQFARSSGVTSEDPTFGLGVEKVETLEDPGRNVVYPSVAAAAAAANLGAVRTPGWLPNGMALDSVMVQGEGRVRLTVTTARLRSMLDALDLRDVQVPTQLDGQQVMVHMPAAVIQKFRSERSEAGLIQAISPDVTLPAGADLAQLGEIGLRILGLDPAEARRMAHAVDWRTTLLIPIPANAASFRQVSVQGHPGLLVLSSGDMGTARGWREGSMLLWTEGDRVFALVGTLRETDVMQVAESLR